MAKTYTSVPNVATGDVYTASTYNTMTAQNINNLRVPPMARVKRATTQSIANVTETVIQWSDPAEFDTDGMWSAASNDRLTVKTTGVYLVTLSVTFAANSTNERIIWIQKNGTSATRYAQSRVSANSTSGADTALSVSAIVSFTADTDYIQGAVYQSSGGAVTIGNTDARVPTQMSVAWLGQVS